MHVSPVCCSVPVSRARGGAISQGQFFDQGFLNHRVRVEGGLLAEESGALLKDFFKARRG